MGLAHKNDIYSCLAETLLLTYNNEGTHYSIEGAELALLPSMERDAAVLEFSISDLQNDTGYIAQNHLLEFAKIIEQRKVL